jgi:hypothetical protein
MISETYVDVRLTLDDEKEGRPFGLVVERFDAGPFQLDEMEIGARASFGSNPRTSSSSPASPAAPSASVCPVARRTSIPAKWRSSVAPASPRRPKCTTTASSSPRCGRRRSARRRGLHRARRFRPSPRCARSRRPAPAVGSALAISSTGSSSATPRSPERHSSSAAPIGCSPASCSRPSPTPRSRRPRGFRRHLDTTPSAYLRKVRLDLAHAELLTACPDDDSPSPKSPTAGASPRRAASPSATESSSGACRARCCAAEVAPRRVAWGDDDRGRARDRG